LTNEGRKGIRKGRSERQQENRKTMRRIKRRKEK
jgi:hypothetical protein